MKWKFLLLLTFIAYVKTPLGEARRYTDVQRYRLLEGGISIQLFLADGKEVIVPAMFTIIEER